MTKMLLVSSALGMSAVASIQGNGTIIATRLGTLDDDALWGVTLASGDAILMPGVRGCIDNIESADGDSTHKIDTLADLLINYELQRRSDARKE